MKKYNKYIFTLALALYGVLGVYAQKPSVIMERKMTERALTVVDSYASQITLGDDETYYSFMELFESENAKIYNDLFALYPSNTRSVSLKDYMQTQRKNTKNLMVSISNVNKDKIWQENGVWKIQMSFDKSIAYSNECGIYFASKDFYEGKSYRIKMILSYIEQDDVCKIEWIDGAIDSKKTLPESFSVFVGEDDRDGDLLYKGAKLTLNSHNQAFLPSLVEAKDFSCSDLDARLKLSFNDACKTVTASYKPRPFRMQLHYDAGLGDAFTLEGGDGLTTSKSSSSNFGLDFGYIIPNKSKFKIGVFMGLGLTNSKIDMSLDRDLYSFTTKADVDGDQYTRRYHNLHLSQSIKMSTFNIPVYFDFAYNFNKIFSMYLDLGAKLNVNMKHDVDAVEGAAYVTGVYPQYDNLLMDEHWGYNGFGNQKYGASNLDNSEILDFSGFTLDLLGAWGIRFSIPKTPLALDLGINYQMGMMDLVKSNAKAVNLSAPSNNEYALIYNTISNGDLSSREHVRNLTESLSSVKARSLKFHVGLIFKF